MIQKTDKIQPEVLIMNKTKMFIFDTDQNWYIFSPLTKNNFWFLFVKNDFQILNYEKKTMFTFSLFANLWAQTDSFHFWSIPASSQTFRTTRVGAVNGKRMRNFVKCNWFNLISLLGTLLVGPSTNTCMYL